MNRTKSVEERMSRDLKALARDRFLPGSQPYRLVRRAAAVIRHQRVTEHRAQTAVCQWCGKQKDREAMAFAGDTPTQPNLSVCAGCWDEQF